MYVYARRRGAETRAVSMCATRNSGCQGIIMMLRRDSVPHFQQLMRRFNTRGGRYRRCLRIPRAKRARTRARHDATNRKAARSYQ